MPLDRIGNDTARQITVLDRIRLTDCLAILKEILEISEDLFWNADFSFLKYYAKFNSAHYVPFCY